MYPLTYAQRVERFILFSEIHSMKDILLPTSESFPIVSSMVINLDLVQAAMCPEILLPVVG